jgi:polyphosphate kinase
MATGNYNAFTSRLYTDIGFMTTDEEMGADASEVFNFLTGFSKQKEYRKFWVAPVNFRDHLTALIDREARYGKHGRIVIKANSVVDPRIIRALYEASRAKVKIDLIIRGICCLRPGVPGVSENIRVMSIVGRFLEHSRIYYFQNQGQPDLFLGSADPMPRNIDRRVEVLFPLENEALRQEMMWLLNIYLHDTAKSHLLQSDGRYLPRITTLAEGEEPFNSQLWLLYGRAANKPLPFETDLVTGRNGQGPGSATEALLTQNAVSQKSSP